MESPIASEPRVEPGEPESIGAYLANHRRMRGISVDELAEATRIPLRSIERLEAGVFDHDVDGFVRGFVRTVSDALGLDTEDTMQRLLHQPRAEARVAAGSRGLSRSAVGLAAVATGAVLLLLAGVQIARSLWMPSAPTAEGLVRRDPVRALAEAQGFDATLDGARLPAPGADTPPDVSARPPLAPTAPEPSPGR